MAVVSFPRKFTADVYRRITFFWAAAAVYDYEDWDEERDYAGLSRFLPSEYSKQQQRRDIFLQKSTIG